MSTQEVPAVAYAPEHTAIEVAGDMLCSSCFQPADAVVRPLKRCSGCRRVSYCSTKCQSFDWKLRHKRFCPQYKKVNEYEKNAAKASSLPDLIKQKSIKEQILSTHGSNQHEPCAACSNNIFKQEIVCEVCFQTPAYHAETFKSFESCHGCGMVRVCSAACKEALSNVHAPDECATLRLLRATERVKIDYHLDRKKLPVYEHLMVPTGGPRQAYVPLARYSGFADYNEGVSSEFGGTPDVSVMYRQLAGSFSTSEPMAAEAVGQLSMEAQSIPLTVIAGLEASIPDITTRRSLEIHFLAAASRELSTRAMSEEILHQFPALRELHIHYVGPEADLPQSTRNWACDVCQARGSSRTWALHSVPYHEFLDQNPTRRPDFIVALNTGWTEVDTSMWAPTLNAVLKLKVPALFTAYSRDEAQQERYFRNKRMHFIVDVQPNKWRGVIPIVNKGIKDSTGQFAMYSSNYWYIFQGR